MRRGGLTTTLFHVESGETLTGTMTIPQAIKLGSQNPYQVLGSGITYLRRYSLESMLGIVSSKDTDANGTQPSVKRATIEKVDNKYVKGSEKYNFTLKQYIETHPYDIKLVVQSVKRRHKPDAKTINELEKDLIKLQTKLDERQNATTKNTPTA